jgi:hypothetical protein
MPYFFISYRRSDQEGRYLAHMIFRELRARYGEHSVFLDVDSLSPGLSFPAKVNRALDQTDVVLVIIGSAWMRILTERISDSTDWVRYEIAQSLRRTWLPVVPILGPGVEIPRADQLPDDLKDLAWRDGITLDPFQDFDSHLNRFIINIERVLIDVEEEEGRLHALRPDLVTETTEGLETVRSGPGARGDLEEFEPVIQLAVKYNRDVSRTEIFLFLAMVPVGILSGLMSGDILVGIGYFVIGAIILDGTILVVVSKSGARKLRDVILSTNFDPTQKMDLADRLHDLTWHARTKRQAKRIISELRDYSEP